MRAALALAGVAFAAVAAGCILVTGGTDGYSVSEAGLSGLDCLTAAACNGQICCVTSDDAGVPSSKCQATCPAPSIQLCTLAQDCGEGGICWAQSCSLEGATVPVSACSPISICTQ